MYKEWLDERTDERVREKEIERERQVASKQHWLGLITPARIWRDASLR